MDSLNEFFSVLQNCRSWGRILNAIISAYGWSTTKIQTPFEPSYQAQEQNVAGQFQSIENKKFQFFKIWISQI
jgi:hypothetical protein